MIPRLKRTLLGRLLTRYVEDDGPTLATVIAFNAMFAMFPIILTVVTIIGLTLSSERAALQVESAIISVFPPSVAEELVAALDTARMNTGTAGALSMLGLLWASSVLMGTIAYALNRIYRVGSRSQFHQTLLDIGMILVFGVLIVVSLVATTVAHLVLAQVVAHVPTSIPERSYVFALLSLALSLGAAFLLFVALYRLLPNASLSFGDVWKGALLGATFVTILQQVFPMYVRVVGGFNQFGAAFGFVFLLMTWFLLVGQLIIIGAELNALLHLPPEKPRIPMDRRVT